MLEFILKILYNSLILPHINYGILTWGNKMKRIHKLQKWAIRTITNSKYNAHTTPLFKKLNLLQARDIFHLSALKLYFKYTHNKLPSYFHNIFEPREINHDHDTRNKHEPQYNQSNTKSADLSVRYRVLQLLQCTSKTTLEKMNTISTVQNFSKFNIKKLYRIVIYN